MKTTKKDFHLFMEACTIYLDKLGLKEWSVFYNHAVLEDAYATTAWKLSGYVATITLNQEWDDLRPKSDREIRRVALHEALHLLLAPIAAEASERYTTQLQLEVAEHQAIRRLENLVPEWEDL